MSNANRGKTVMVSALVILSLIIASTVFVQFIVVPPAKPAADISIELETPLSKDTNLSVDEQALAESNCSHQETTTATDSVPPMARTQKRLEFRGAPLSEVVAVFNLHNDQQIVLVDQSIKDIQVAGLFSSEDADSFLQSLEQLLDLEATVSTDGCTVYLTRRAGS